MKAPVSLSKRVLSFLIISIFIFNNLSAQDDRPAFWKGWSLNANGGANLFYGDTDNYRFYRVFRNNSEWRFGYSLMLQKELSPLFTLRGQLMHGQLSGTKRKDTIWFEGDIIETSMSLKLDVTGLIWGVSDRKFSIYAMAGIGLAHWETELKNLRTNDVIKGNGHKTGSGLFRRTMEPVFPFGMGVDYQFARRWSLNLEGTLRPVNSDKLDANEGGFAYDFYSYNFVGITYHFIKREKKKPEIPPREIVYEEPVEVPEPSFKPTVKEPPAEPAPTLEDQLLEAEKGSGLYDSPWPGVEFRVQVAASKTVDDPEMIRKKYNLPGELEMNEGDGWYRYSMGGFVKYWKAREYRNIVITRYNVKDAFVVAYRDGKRISMAELISGAEPREGELIVENKRPVIDRAFSVQVLASADGTITTGVFRALFEIEEDVYKEQRGGLYLYTVGNFEDYNDAARFRNKMEARGVSGAFVVGYKNGERVDDINEVLD